MLMLNHFNCRPCLFFSSFPSFPSVLCIFFLPHGDATLSTQSSQATIAQFDRYVIPNYRRYPVSLVRGEGSWIWDAEGQRYLDFFPGWGCNLLGHCPPRVVEAVREQVGQLIHVPNTWYTEAQGALAEALSKRSFGGRVFSATAEPKPTRPPSSWRGLMATSTGGSRS